MDTMRRVPQSAERQSIGQQPPDSSKRSSSSSNDDDSLFDQPSSRRSMNTSNRGGRKSSSTKRKFLIGLVGLVVIAAIVVGGWFAVRSFSPQLIDTGKYQAVFLSNGQVYFGKLKINNNYYVLTDIFYLQTTSTSGSGSSETSNVQNSSSTSSNVQLIKLGTEVHGPEDEMVIDKSQVLFFENLKDDGSVVKSIKSYDKSNN